MKIKNQLAIFIFLFFTVFALVITLLVYYRAKNILLDKAYSQLESISETKYLEIKNLIKRNFELADLITKNIFLIGYYDSLLKNRSDRNQWIVNSRLKEYTRIVERVQVIYITDTTGIVLSSSEPKFINKDFSKREGFIEGSKGHNYLDGFSFTSEGKLILSMSSPIFKDNEIIGILIIELLATDIIGLTNNYTGLGRTGESTLTKKYDSTVFLTPVRYSDMPPLSLKLPSDDLKYSANLALNQKEGLYENVYDYRNELIIASTRYIPETKWGLTTEMDAEEILEPVNNLRNILLITLFIFILTAVVVSFLLGNYFAKPIVNLISSIIKVREGNYSQRITSYPNNEIGTLAISYNQMCEQLDIQMNELEHSNQALNKYAYIISHDLKAPVQSIYSLAHLIKEDYTNKQLDEEGNKMLDMMVQKAELTEQLIEGVLAAARKRTGIIQKELIDSEELIQKVISNLSPPPNFKFELKKPLPVVRYNKVQLIQIFQNLFSNSIKFMDKPIGLVEIEAKELTNQYKFLIRDNGKGMSEEKLKNLFILFETGESKEIKDSSGIGLATIKKIITENNGEVWAESQLGVGTTFYFTIPKQ